jgi:hypothetical protein
LAIQPSSSNGHHKSPYEQSDKQSDRPPLTPRDKKQHEHLIVDVDNEHLISSVVTGFDTAHEAAPNEIVISEEETGTASQMTSEEMEVEAELD